MERKGGYYFGTEVDEKWWSRCRDDGFFARGNGDFWIEDDGIYFLRKLTRKPIFIAFRSVREVKLGSMHAGKWTPGVAVLKIVWEKDGRRLSSGFGLGWKKDDAVETKELLERRIAGNV